MDFYKSFIEFLDTASSSIKIKLSKKQGEIE